MNDVCRYRIIQSTVKSLRDRSNQSTHYTVAAVAARAVIGFAGLVVVRLYLQYFSSLDHSFE